ncbi:hypothetical protein GW750_07775 [bacterium]|nr:hypothetical protein [bacterium]
MGVSHCLAATHQDLSKITTAFSHPQALAQCYSFLTNHDIKQQKYADTA